MKTAIVKNMGFIGDILFSTSAAKDLKCRYDMVLYQMRFWEPFELLKLNPYIDDVIVSSEQFDYDKYDQFVCGEVDQSEPATIQFQRACGVKNPELSYRVYTNKNFDWIAQMYILHLRQTQKKKVIAYQANWEDRTFGFTKEEYARGIDIPPFGYGGRRRAIAYILEKLARKYTLVEVGLPSGAPNGTLGVFSAPMYSMTASIIKNCDWMIGGEGGLSNLAAGVGTKTIITGDFIHQLYGWNGCIKKIAEPKMGPKTYFPDEGHVTLDPFLTDDEVIEQMENIIG